MDTFLTRCFVQNLQAMDNSHVALVSVHLDESGFKKYRCDRPLPLGVNLNSLTKVLKCAKVRSRILDESRASSYFQDDDACILKASDDADILNLTYESKSGFIRVLKALL
jgi:proliferating cell nuclear antigen